MCGVRLGVALGLPRRCHRVRRLLNAFCFDTVSKMSMFRFSDFRIFDTAVYNKSDSVFLKRKSETQLNTSVRNTTYRGCPLRYIYTHTRGSHIKAPRWGNNEPLIYKTLFIEKKKHCIPFSLPTPMHTLKIVDNRLCCSSGRRT